jgi:hypothetical protein
MSLVFLPHRLKKDTDVRVTERVIAIEETGNEVQIAAKHVAPREREQGGRPHLIASLIFTRLRLCLASPQARPALPGRSLTRVL